MQNIDKKKNNSCLKSPLKKTFFCMQNIDKKNKFFLAENNPQTLFEKGKNILNQAILKNSKENVFFSLKILKKAYFLSSKQKKRNNFLENLNIEFYISKGFLTLGKMLKEEKYFEKAKKIYEKIEISFSNNYSLALHLYSKNIKLEKISLRKNLSKTSSFNINRYAFSFLKNLYLDYGKLLIEIYNLSKEPSDLKNAILLYKNKIFSYEKTDIHFITLANLYFQMGTLTNKKRMYVEAIKYFEKAKKNKKYQFYTFKKLAFSYTELYINTLSGTFFEKANRYFEKSINIKKDEKLILNWAQLINEQGKNKKDLTLLDLAYKKCMSIRKKTLAVKAQIIESLALSGAYSNDLNLIKLSKKKAKELVKTYPNSLESFYVEGISFLALSKYFSEKKFLNKAIKKFKKGFYLDTTNAESAYEIGKAYIKLAKETEDKNLFKMGIKFLYFANDLKPDFPNILFDLGKTFFEIAEITEDLDCAKKAIFYFEKLLKNPKDSIIQNEKWLFYYALSLNLLGNLIHEDEVKYLLKAKEVYEKVLIINPDFYKINFYLGLCSSNLTETAPDEIFFKQAINHFNIAISKDKEDDEAFLEKAIALIGFSENKPDPSIYYLKAEKNLLKSASLGNQKSFYFLACLYSILKRFDDSMYMLEKSKNSEILPGLEEILEDEWLDNIRCTKAFHLFIKKIEKKATR